MLRDTLNTLSKYKGISSIKKNQGDTQWNNTFQFRMVMRRWEFWGYGEDTDTSGMDCVDRWKQAHGIEF